MTTRVVLADDHYLVRTAVEQLIATEPDLTLVASCDDLPSLRKAVADHDPDVVLTDIRMPPTSTDEGIQIAAELRTDRPTVGVVVLSQFAEAEYALQLLAGGSEGRAYLLKERVAAADELADAIRTVAAGGSYIDPKVVEGLVSSGRSAQRSAISSLTPRETEVLSAMAQGMNNKAIADDLVLSERAVEKHINSIFSKLGLTHETTVHRRVKAVLVYLTDTQS